MRYAVSLDKNFEVRVIISIFAWYTNFMKRRSNYSNLTP